MRYKRAKIDSLNLSNKSFEQLFTYSDYIIEDIKTIGVFEPDEWVKTFGKPLTRNIIEAKILHTNTGLTIPLKRYSRSPQKQVIEFAGLHGYNERSKLLNQVLRDKWSQLQDTEIKRFDIAIDYQGEIPKRVIKKLLECRTPFIYKNTTYCKTENEKKVNQYIDIKIYDKAKKEKLDYPLERIEFAFKGNYFSNLQLKSINKAYKKMEKTIKKFIGITVKIRSINTL